MTSGICLKNRVGSRFLGCSADEQKHLVLGLLTKILLFTKYPCISYNCAS